MEEEELEVDQENAETNSAGGNVRIQIYIFNVYCRIPILRKYMYVFLQFCGFVSN